MFEQINIKLISGLESGQIISIAAEEYLGDICINPKTLEIRIV